MVRTRFAPSPTGYLHIGGLRTALYAYLFARHEGGEFYLRIEDTDRSRYVEGAEEKLQESLRWAGITWDNDPIMYQSKRLDVYKKFSDRLVSEGKAYPCFCTPEELQEMRKKQQSRGEAPKYDRRCLMLPEEERQKRIAEGAAHVIRFLIPDKETAQVEFTDAVRGRVGFRSELLDDQVIIKSDGFPTYHLASVVDDHEMGITHVIRGEEWLPSTPKHIFLYRAFGWEEPTFAHLPLLLNTDRSKLSKRQGDVAVEDYVAQGYLKESILNFVALLGWNPGGGSEKEMFSLEDLVREFSLEKINKAGAVFDMKRLDWMNGEYIKRLSLDELYIKTLPFVEAKSWYKEMQNDKLRMQNGNAEEFLKRVLAVEQERMSRLNQVGEQNPFFFEDPTCEKEDLRWKEMTDEDVKIQFEKALALLENTSDEYWTREKLQEILLDAAGDNRGEFLWPLRMAMSGAKQSPPPQDIAWVIGKEETLNRVNNAIKIVK